MARSLSRCGPAATFSRCSPAASMLNRPPRCLQKHPEGSAVIPKASKQAPTLGSREGGDDLKHNHKHKRQVLSPRPLGCARVVRRTRVETCSRERRERGKSKKTRPRQKIESKRARGGETKWCCCSLRGLVTSRRSMRGGAKGNGTSSGARRKKDVPSKLGWDGLDG